MNTLFLRASDMLNESQFMKMISRWTCFKNMKLSAVKKFYLHCVDLATDCQYIGQFHKIFLLMCIVALHEYEDTVIDTEISILSLRDARRQLESLISVMSMLI